MSSPRSVMDNVRRAGRLGRFAGWFTGRLLAANVVVAREVLTRGSGLAPGIVDLPLRCRTPAEIVALTGLIGLTPGTLTVEIDQEAPLMYVHGMHVADADAFRARLSDLEDRFLAAVRRDGDGGPA